MQRKFPGRQYMRGLQLEFREGRVTGSGSDRIGPFNLTGEYELKTGKVTLLKRYARHRVKYTGQNENDGKWVWGVWTLASDRGGFHLWPKGEADPTVQRTAVEEEIPVEGETVKV